MKQSILEKLSQEIIQGVDTEQKTLYILAEIRKFLENSGQKTRDKYPNLYFFGNWVLHIKLDHTPARNILKRFDNLTSFSKSLKEISKDFIANEVRFFQFYDLKDELEDFLKENNLPLYIVRNVNQWIKFKRLLVAILKDCPLVNESGKIWKFSFIEEVNDKTCFRVYVKGLRENGSFKIMLKDITHQN